MIEENEPVEQAQATTNDEKELQNQSESQPDVNNIENTTKQTNWR